MTAGIFRSASRALAGVPLGLMALAALGLAGAASAKQLALGSDGHGVHVVRYRGLTFTFGNIAAARYEQIAGRRIAISCDRVSAAGAGWIVDFVDGSAEFRAPQKRGPISTGFPMPGDLCSLGVLTSPSQERIVAVVPLTVRGLDYISQQNTALKVESVWARPASLKAFDGVALPSPRSAPPRGKLGLFNRGGREYVAMLDRTGVRVFIEQSGGSVTTNLVAGYMLDTRDRGPYTGQTLTIPQRRLVWVYAA
ncbi:MAG: hypothetical protein M3076_01205 [Actinomycetota bacterium]|nr:hypothetical protein [Actinomycetota bacterium]